MSNDKPREPWERSECPRCGRSSESQRLVIIDEKHTVHHYCRAGHHWNTEWEQE